MLSSRYTTHPFKCRSPSTFCINHWNVAGAFLMPNGIRCICRSQGVPQWRRCTAWPLLLIPLASNWTSSWERWNTWLLPKRPEFHQCGAGSRHLQQNAGWYASGLCRIWIILLVSSRGQHWKTMDCSRAWWHPDLASVANVVELPLKGRAAPNAPSP